MKRGFLIVLGCMAAVPTAAQTAPAASQQPATPAAGATATAAPRVGATIYGSDGNPVGTVESISNGVAVIATGANKVPVPLDRLGTSEKGAAIAMTKAELDAAVVQAKAQSASQVKALLTPGTEIRDLGGTTVVGKVKESAADAVTVTTTKGSEVRLPLTAFAASQAGLTIGMSAADFEKAVAGS